MTNTTYLKQDITCEDCGFTTRDVALFNNHSCDVALQGNRCEDYPCCGHEAGDCNGLKYGSDEAIKQEVYDRWNDPDIDPMDPHYDLPDYY
jgi:hypothetical protein